MTLTAEQLQTRKQGIGGSEVAALIGCNRFSGPMEVYLNKTGQAQPFEETTHTRRGTYLEGGILKWYADEYQRTVEEPGTLIHPKHPIVIATPDGISHGAGESVVVEVKCPAWRASRDWGEPGTDQVPEYYWPQLQWEMGVTGLKKAHAVAFFGDELNVYVVDFDNDVFEGLVRVAEDFWRNHVTKRVPPSIDASAAYATFITHQHPWEAAPMRESDPDLDTQLATLRDATEEIKAHQAIVDQAKNWVKNWLGDSEGATSHIGKVTWRKQKDTQVVDYKAVLREADVPGDLISKHTAVRVGPRVLRTTFR